MKVPFAVLHAEQDKLCNVLGSKVLFEKAQVKDKYLKVFPVGCHHLYRETQIIRQEALDDTVSWICQRVPSRTWDLFLIFVLIFSKKWPRSLWSLFNFKNEKSLILPLYIIPNRYMQLGVQSMISNSKNNSYQEKGCGGYSIIPEYGMDIKFKKNLCF